MKPNRVNHLLAQLANIGVVAGLVIVILEIQQNNALTMAQIEQSRSESLLQWRREWALNDHLAPLRAKMRRLAQEYEVNLKLPPNASERQRLAKYVLDQLEPVERERANSMIMSTYFDFENVYFQYKRGLFSDKYWNERIVPGIVQDAPRWKAVHGDDLAGLGREEFNQEVERILKMED